MEFIGHLILTGKLECLTGFATRGEHPTYRVAAVDLPVLRNPITQMPYIPGSLLKGKLRYLLEQCYADQVVPQRDEQGRTEGICRCGKRECPVCPLFGVEHGGAIEVGCRPARLRFLDLLPTEETRKRWEEERRTWGNFTEMKAENTVDRVSLAANPRLIERVPPGACFHYEVQMGLYRFNESDDPLADLDKLPVLQTAFRLLEDDTLGGHGSRGYGQVRVHPGEARFVSRVDYHLKRTGTTLSVREQYRKDIQDYREQAENTPSAVASVPNAAQQPSQSTSDIHIVTFRPYHTLVSAPLHSDTLFGALAWALRLVCGPDKPSVVEELLHEPAIAFSSVFPFVCNPCSNFRLLFFPRPLGAPLPLQDNDKDRKTFAGWRYASLEVFNRLSNGEVTEEQIRNSFCALSPAATKEQANNHKEYLCLDRKYLLTRKEYEQTKDAWKKSPLFDEADLTRTRIDRRSGGAAEGKLFFTQEVLTTDEHSGYFFLIRASQEIWQKWEEPLAAALAFLADRGLGGDISAGRGKLKDQRIEGFTGLREPGEPTRFVTLSLYSPKKGEVPTLQDCWYNLLPRKGKVEMTYLTETSPFKTRIQMFVEGSTFLLVSDGVQGQNPSVSPDTGKKPFSIYQWGRPFAVRMKG